MDRQVALRELAERKSRRAQDQIKRDLDDRLRRFDLMAETPHKFAHLAFGAFYESAIQAVCSRADIHRNTAAEHDDPQMLSKPALDVLRSEIEQGLIDPWLGELKHRIKLRYQKDADRFPNFGQPDERRYVSERGRWVAAMCERLTELRLESKIGLPKDREKLLSPGELIAAFCEKRGMSFKELAGRAGISRNTLGKIRNGESVRSGNITEVARVMNCSYDDLLPA